MLAKRFLSTHTQMKLSTALLDSLIRSLMREINVMISLRQDNLISARHFSFLCSYLSRTKYDQLSLVNDPQFVWLLGYDVDTTVATSSCPYDRYERYSTCTAPEYPAELAQNNVIFDGWGLHMETTVEPTVLRHSKLNKWLCCRFIVHAALNGSVLENSATVFNFTEEYSLNATQVAVDVYLICVHMTPYYQHRQQVLVIITLLSSIFNFKVHNVYIHHLPCIGCSVSLLCF